MEAIAPSFPPEETPTAGPRSTARPPSSHEIGDTDRLLGELMASQTRLEAAWRTRSEDFETSMRELTAALRDFETLSSEVHEIRKEMVHSTRRVKFATRAAPAFITIVEIARMVFSHYYGVG